MSRKKTPAFAYLRTSSAANVGEGKDSDARQRSAIEAFAKARGYEVVAEFYDAAVSGSDPIGERQGFQAMLARIAGNGVRTILIESPDRFARDLAVQLAGHDMLRELGVELIPTTSPDFFTDDTPTAVLVRQVLGAVAEFDRAQTVAKLKAARDRKSNELGRRIEGRKPVPEEVVKRAKKLRRRSPKTGKPMSLRAIAERLASEGYVAASGAPYNPNSVRQMLER